jgi:hypothetical protein
MLTINLPQKDLTELDFSGGGPDVGQAIAC